MKTGEIYERRAERALRARGLHIVERNFRCRLGEIDLICRDGDLLIFVEVRYRSATGYASSAASITRAKQRRLLRAAQTYMQRQGISERVPCRIDVIAFDGERSAAEDGIQWIKDAISL